MSDPALHRPRAGTAAVLTGATSGDGRRLVLVLASRDLAVVVAYLRDASAADAVVDEVLAAGGTALAIRADLTDAIDVERLFDETEAAFGTVDVVVHAARRGASEVLAQAARTLAPGGLVVHVAADTAAPALVDALRARGVTVDALEGAGTASAALGLARLLDGWRDAQGADQGVHGRDGGATDSKLHSPDDLEEATMTTEDIGTLAQLLRETAEHHDHFEKASPPHDWWDWYAPYLAARQEGETSEAATAAADRYMAEVHHVVAG